MKRILFVCAKYATKPEDAYLTNDLVNEFCRLGYAVTVVALGDANLVRDTELLRERVICISSQVKYLKYFVLWPRLTRALVAILAGNRSFDSVIVTAPLAVIWPISVLLPFIASASKTAVIFDIFPLHQVLMGSIPAFAGRPLRWIEKLLMKPFSTVTAMGPNNRKTICDYYLGNRPGVEVKTVTLWGKPLGEGGRRGEMCRGEGPIRIIFGGQVIKGRRLDKLIEFLGMLVDRGVELTLSIYSQGQGFRDLKAQFVDTPWIEFHDQISRDRYIETLSLYDVGAIVTDEQVPLPTFPSKIIDYLQTGLFSLCLVERESDLYDLVGHSCRVHLNSFDFSARGIEAAVDFFAAMRRDDSSIEAHALSDLFTVEKAAERILA